MKMIYVAFEGTPTELQTLDAWPDILAAVRHPASANANSVVLDGAPTSTESPATQPMPALDPRLDAFISKRGGNNPALNLLRQYAAQAINDGVAEWHIGTSTKEEDGQAKYFALYAPGPRRFGAASYVHPVNGRTTFRLSWDDPAIAAVKKLAFKASDDPGATYAVGIMLTSDAALKEARALLARAVEVALG